LLHRQKVIWSTGSIVARKHTPTRRAFLDWHRAHLLGLRVEACELDGRALDAPELFRLNFWISAQGAWRCSLLSLPEAHEVLRRVISGSLRRVPVGRSGAGRWASGSTSGKSGFEFPESRQGILRLDFGQNP